MINVNHRETTAEDRQINSSLEFDLDEARKQLNDLLKNQSEKGKSWVDIKGKPYLKVATLKSIKRCI